MDKRILIDSSVIMLCFDQSPRDVYFQLFTELRAAGYELFYPRTPPAHIMERLTRAADLGGFNQTPEQAGVTYQLLRFYATPTELPAEVQRLANDVTPEAAQAYGLLDAINAQILLTENVADHEHSKAVVPVSPKALLLDVEALQASGQEPKSEISFLFGEDPSAVTREYTREELLNDMLQYRRDQEQTQRAHDQGMRA